MSIGVDSTTNLMIARRLLIASQQAEARRRGEKVETKTAKELWEEDQALLSGETEATSSSKQRPASDNDTRIRLSDLSKRLQELQASSEGNQSNSNSTSISQKTLVATYRKTEITIDIQAWAPVQGLVVRNKNLAETDRYEFDFQNGYTFKITDKWSGKSTTIWGDPHVDTSDEEGNLNGEFSDLKDSDTHTTLMLQDGTRVTFTARDNGVIEQVDIFKGSQHLKGIGGASINWNEENGLFQAGVTDSAASAVSSVPMGDVVYAGGDGNDWYDSAKRLVWGQTTGPIPTSRPAATVQVKVQQTIQQIAFQSIDFRA